MTNAPVPRPVDVVLNDAATLIREKIMFASTVEALRLADLANQVEMVRDEALHAIDYRSGLTAYMTGGAPTHNPHMMRGKEFRPRTAAWTNGFMAGKTVDLGGRERQQMQYRIERLQGQLLDAIDAGGVVPESCEADYTMLDMMREAVQDLATGPSMEVVRRAPPRSAPANFQDRVQEWILECFGPEIAADLGQRRHRFLEEALELVQASGGTLREVEELSQYVFGRPAGETAQETGGVLLTLAGFCTAHGVDMVAAGETELSRVWTKVPEIRKKQAARVEGSALPGKVESPAFTPELVFGSWSTEGHIPTPVTLWAGSFLLGKGKAQVASILEDIEGARLGTGICVADFQIESDAASEMISWGPAGPFELRAVHGDRPPLCVYVASMTFAGNKRAATLRAVAGAPEPSMGDYQSTPIGTSQIKVGAYRPELGK
jgi:NTP pyrophosphatase (non-canonical NTP hydrolase)